MQFKGKVAVVTGSTDGIGLAIAKRLGRDGAKVVICSRKQENVDRALKDLRNQGITVEGIVCNVGKSNDRESLINFLLLLRSLYFWAVEKFGRIDILVNNAGINPHRGSLLDVTEQIWDKICIVQLFETNVKAGFLLSKMVVPIMEKQKGGNIIFNSSVAGYISRDGIMAYGVTKTALLGLVKALASTLAPSNIRVNCIAPGIIQTRFNQAIMDQEKRQIIDKRIVPLGRVGYPDDCSGAVAFLCSDEASYITGETMLISGGFPARL